jgi:tight adherence protein C
MQIGLSLLLFFSIVSAIFIIIGKDKPKTNLLHTKPKVFHEPKGPLTKKMFQVKRVILRIISPLARFLTEKIGVGEKTKLNLISAGSPLAPGEFLAFKVLSGLTVLIAAAFFPVARENPVLIFLATVVSYFIPDMWLKQIIKRRHREVVRDLPLIIDLLILCIDAGLDFMLAVERTIKEFRKESVIMGEFKGLAREIKMGLSRAQALRNLSARLNMPEVSSFARTLIQADKLGSPIGDALRIQSEELRLRRFQRGEEMALKAPIKLLIPLLFCILPVVLIVVGGPILLQFLRGGFSLGGM